MATASGSLASHRVPKRLRPDLPLIGCGASKCGKIVQEYQVRKKYPNSQQGSYLL